MDEDLSVVLQVNMYIREVSVKLSKLCTQ